MAESDQKERERDMGMAEFVPLQPTKLSFFEKMWELQVFISLFFLYYIFIYVWKKNNINFK